MGSHDDIPIKYHKIKNIFLLKRKIGKGSFGIIYTAQNINSKEYVAVKFEKISIKKSSQTLLKEAKILHIIYKDKLEGFPKIIYFNKDEYYRMLIMTLLGRNLQRCLEKATNGMSNATILKLGLKLVEDLERLHEIGYIHRDLKPENICTDPRKTSDNIYLIDFGLSKSYLDDKGNHIKIREKRGLVGTIRYTSINSHLSIEQSRRDDLESLGYILVYLSKGKLPWQGLIFFDEDTRIRRIAELKCSISVEDLTEGTPRALCKLMKHVKELKFPEKPDYEYLKSLFIEEAKENEINLAEHCFEWQSKKSNNTEIESNSGPKTQQKKYHSAMNNEIDEELDENKKVLATSTNMLQIPNGKKSAPKKKKGGSASSNNLDNINSNSIIESNADAEKAFQTHEVRRDSGSIYTKEDFNLSLNIGSKQNIELLNKKDSSPNSLDDEDLNSEDYSRICMDENTSSIQQKLAYTTLTKSKLITDIAEKNMGTENYKFPQ